jgi:hypothetical protein
MNEVNWRTCSHDYKQQPYSATKTSKEAGRLAIREGEARRYTPRVTLRRRKRKKLLTCVESFSRIDFLSLEDAKDKPMQKVAPIPAA